MTLPLRHPVTALVAGPTGCGKTRFVFKLIQNVGVMIDPTASRIVYCYGEYQTAMFVRALIIYQHCNAKPIHITGIILR